MRLFMHTYISYEVIELVFLNTNYLCAHSSPLVGAPPLNHDASTPPVSEIDVNDLFNC